jgi:hypothetical protein
MVLTYVDRSFHQITANLLDIGLCYTQRKIYIRTTELRSPQIDKERVIFLTEYGTAS